MKKSLSIIFLSALTLCACTERIENIPEKDSGNEVKETPFVEGVITVCFSEEMTVAIESAMLSDGVPVTKSTEFNSLLAAMGASSMERVFPDAGEWEARHRKAGLHRWYTIHYDEDSLPRTKVQLTLDAIDGVVYAEPVRKIKKEEIPFNDPMADRQWHYFNDGNGGSNYKAGADINVVPVWNNFTGGKKEVIVAVVDEGVDLAHEDLSAVAMPLGKGSKCFIDGYVGGAIVPGNHGTHVAGTIAAINNNGIGVCGIAGGTDGNGGVTIMSCETLREDPENPKNTLQGNPSQALVWAADNGAVIANNSWGYNFKTKEDAANGSVGAVGTAIDYFIENAGIDKNGNQTGPMRGGVVIFAAGNDGWPNAWPAQYEKVIAVGASNSSNGKARYSNYGDWVDIAAPGGDDALGIYILSCTTSNSYSNMQGTSMACPHVSGVAALIVSQFGGPGFTNEMLVDRLVNGANHKALPAGAQIGPLVDAYGSFTYGGTTAPELPADYQVSAVSNNLSFKWKVTEDEDDIKAYAYMLLACKDKSLLESVKGGSVPSGVSKTIVHTGTLGIGEEIEGRVGGLEFEQDYYVSLLAFDYNMNYSQLAPVKKVSTGINNKPVISTEYEGSFVIAPHEKLSVDYLITDPDGHAVTVNVDPGSEALTYTVSGDVYSLYFVGKNAPTGKYKAIITATDSYGAEERLELEYSIRENAAPVVRNQFEDVIFEKSGVTNEFDMTEYFYDADGEVLKYNCTVSQQNVVHLMANGNTMFITSLSPGTTEVQITAVDARGESASLSFKAAVVNAKSPVSVYPGQVRDYCYVRTGTDKNVKLTVLSQTGTIVMETEGKSNIFEPMKVDMTALAPGLYVLRLNLDGEQLDRKIVKL